MMKMLFATVGLMTSLASVSHAAPVLVTSLATQNADETATWSGGGPSPVSSGSGSTFVIANNGGPGFTQSGGVLTGSTTSVPGREGFGLRFFGPVQGAGLTIFSTGAGGSGTLAAIDEDLNELASFSISLDSTPRYFGINLDSINLRDLIFTYNTPAGNTVSLGSVAINSGLAAAAPEIDGSTATLPLALTCVALLGLKRRRRPALSAGKM